LRFLIALKLLVVWQFLTDVDAPVSEFPVTFLLRYELILTPQDGSTPTEPLPTIEAKLVLWLIELLLFQLIFDDQFQLSDAFEHL